MKLSKIKCENEPNAINLPNIYYFNKKLKVS